MAGSTPASPTAEAETPSATAAAAPAALVESALPAAVLSRRRVSPGRDAWRRFRRHRLALASAGLLSLIILTVVLGPLLWPVPINDIDFAATLSPPSWQHPFGTDDLGQNLFAHMLYGSRISLAIKLAAMLVAVVVGTIVG